MSGQKRLWAGFTDSEILEKLKRESSEFKAQQEKEGRETEPSRWQRFLRKVRGEQQQRAEQRKSEAATFEAMTPAELIRHERASTTEVLTRAAPRFAKGYMIALQDIRSEDLQRANREREDAERRAGIPKLQADSAARCQEIRDAGAAELAQLDERRQAVLERQRRKLAEEEERLRAEVQAVRESLEVPA